MFGSISLGQNYSSKDYKELEPQLQMKLFALQEKCEELNIPVLITIAGLDGTGRGKIVNLLSKWFDAKKMRNHTFWNPTDEAHSRPESWRYWIQLPKSGEIGIFIGGWYSEPIRKAAANEISHNELDIILAKRTELERILANDGYAIMKLWLHIDKNAHDERQQKRKKEKGSYHFTPYDEKSDANYDALVSTVAKAIPETDREYAPWCIIDAYDDNFRNVAVARALIQQMEHAIDKKLNAQNLKLDSETEIKSRLAQSMADESVAILDRVDMSKSIEKDVYKKELAELTNELFQLTYKAYHKGISSTIIFEGWDAGGKGGAIRRICEAVDSRITRIIPISSPTDEELSHHYLWRFWRHVPMAGYVTIYDRSWYGRVLVERVEGYAKPEEWKRAYSEINDFEEQLVDKKNILLKFWMHITPEEQLARFEDRQKTPWKNYKITDDDWRNREKAPLYKVAADEMFMRTDTLYAPWHIIAANSKQYARIEVMKIYRDVLKKALGEKPDDKEDEVYPLLSVEDAIEKTNGNSKVDKDKKKKKNNK